MGHPEQGRLGSPDIMHGTSFFSFLRYTQTLYQGVVFSWGRNLKALHGDGQLEKSFFALSIVLVGLDDHQIRDRGNASLRIATYPNPSAVKGRQALCFAKFKCFPRYKMIVLLYCLCRWIRHRDRGCECVVNLSHHCCLKKSHLSAAPSNFAWPDMISDGAHFGQYYEVMYHQSLIPEDYPLPLIPVRSRRRSSAYPVNLQH